MNKAPFFIKPDIWKILHLAVITSKQLYLSITDPRTTNTNPEKNEVHATRLRFFFFGTLHSAAEKSGQGHSYAYLNRELIAAVHIKKWSLDGTKKNDTTAK